MENLKKALNESAATRWGVMLLVSITMGVNYYFYDALSPLKELITEKLKFTSTDYGLFVSAYSIPNVFLLMAVIGGIILDKIGIRITGFVFVVFMVIGAAITAYGSSDYYNQGGFGYQLMGSFLTSYSPSLKMMFLGFFLFGLGAETSIVVISKIIVKWFKGKELAMALGVNLAIGRLGMAAALIISPRLTGLTWPIWLGTILLAIGFLTFLIYIIFDLKIDRQLKSTNIEEELPFKFSDVGDLLKNPTFIYIALLCLTFYSAVFPFVKYAPDLMVNKYGFSREMSGTIVSLLPFGNIIFTPLFGWICDFKGKSATLMIYGSILLILVHFLFGMTTINPYVPMFILGVAFSLVPAAMWPSVAKIVDVRKIGTAYGLMFSIQNIGLWAFPILIGKVLDRSNPGVAEAIAAGEEATYNYTNPIIMLMFLGLLGVVFAFLLKREDKTSGYGLELPNKAKEK
ncbi:MFS transporter [Bacteroidota bacterium]